MATKSLTKPLFNEKQLAFMRAYVVNQNATQAAIEAGYSKKTARSQGQRLLTDVDIKHFVDTALARIAEKQQVRAEDVIEHTRYIGLSNLFDYCRFDDNGEATFDLEAVERKDRMLGAAIQSIKSTKFYEKGTVVRSTCEFKLHDKKAALDKLDAATGAFHKHNPGAEEGKTIVNIQVNTGIPGAPGSLVRRDYISVEESAR